LDLEPHRMAEVGGELAPLGVPDTEVRGDVDLLVLVAVRDREAAARAHRGHRRADAAREAATRFGDTRQMLDVGAGADVHVDAGDDEARTPRALDRRLEVLVPDAVLAVLAARVRLAAVAVAEAGIDAQRDLARADARGVLVDHLGRAAVHRDA